MGGVGSPDPTRPLRDVVKSLYLTPALFQENCRRTFSRGVTSPVYLTGCYLWIGQKGAGVSGDQAGEAMVINTIGEGGGLDLEGPGQIRDLESVLEAETMKFADISGTQWGRGQTGVLWLQTVASAHKGPETWEP